MNKWTWVYLLLGKGCFYFHFWGKTLRKAEYKTMNTFHISLRISKTWRRQAYLTSHLIPSTQEIRCDFLCDIAMPRIHKHPKVVKAEKYSQVLYFISYKKEQNLQLLHTTSCYQPQYKSSTRQEKLNSKGKYTNIAQVTKYFRIYYLIWFSKTKKFPGKYWLLRYPFYRGKTEPQRIFAYILPTYKVAEWRF